MRDLLIAFVVVLMPGGLLLLAIAIGKRLRTVSTEPTIAPLSADHYRFVGHDEALAVQTLAKRAEAETLKRLARQLETSSERPRLRRVH